MPVPGGMTVLGYAQDTLLGAGAVYGSESPTPCRRAHCWARAIATQIANPSSWPSFSSALAISMAFARTRGSRCCMAGGYRNSFQGTQLLTPNIVPRYAGCARCRGSRVVSILITVVLPAPLVPSNPKICLPAIVTCTELTAVTEPKQRVSATVSTAGRSAVGGLRESPFGSEAGVKTSGIDTVR